MAALASFKVSWLFPVEERELLIFKIIVLLYLCVKKKEALALLEEGEKSCSHYRSEEATNPYNIVCVTGNQSNFLLFI